jgi:mannose-1-phosphate guanylyltransferase
LYGEDLPKQFAVLAGDRSLLQQTIERAKLLTCVERISVVVSNHREALAREQLARYPGLELVVQPRNLDTGPGVLLPLSRILARAGSEEARVVFLPSDHYIVDDAPLVEALRASAHGRLGSKLALVGVAPTGPEVDYGWIVPGPRLGKTKAYAIARFAEKPEAGVAEVLWRDGGLWNTFISAGPVATFWGLARRYLAQHVAAFERYLTAIGGPDERTALIATYRDMRPANFSHEILAHADNLAVVPVGGTGWSDWGSPKRVFASLAGTPSHARLVARIRGDELALAG